MKRKYEFTGETQEFNGRTLRRIRAVRRFGSVEAGDIGGWLESEDNLSHDGDCWVYNSARVYDNAQVYNSARVGDSARVYGSAWVGGSARVCDSAVVSGSAQVCGSAVVSEKCSRSPLTAQLTRHEITATDNHIRIGCEVHTYKEWLMGYREIGAEAGYSKDEISQYGKQIKLMAEIAGKLKVRKPLKKKKKK